MPHYFIADLHLCDPRVIKYREDFRTLGYHDEFICDTVLKNLRKNDTFSMVGDCIINDKSLELIKKFPCRKILYLGNHDLERRLSFSDLIGIVDDIRGTRNWSSHFNVGHVPCHPDHRRNKVIIHGHLHDVIIPDPNYINVSLDATGFRLIQAEEIIEGTYRTYRDPAKSIEEIMTAIAEGCE